MNTEVKEKVDVANGQHDLVRGEFTPEDARDILNNLIAKKINFHQMRNFSNEIRYGEKDKASEKRIKELKQSKEQMLTLIDEAEMKGKNVRINANILINIA